MVQVWLAGDRLEIHLTGEDTGGSHCLVRDHPSPSFALVPHVHRNEDETIHIVDGTFDFVLDGVSRELGPGDTAFVPRGTVHAIRNTGPVAGCRVLLFSPAGIEHFFLEAGSASEDDQPDVRALMAAAERHGWEVTTGEDGRVGA